MKKRIKVTDINAPSLLKEGTKVFHDYYGEGEVQEVPRQNPFDVSVVFVKFYQVFKIVGVTTLEVIEEVEDLAKDVQDEIKDVVSITKRVVKFFKKLFSRFRKKK